MVIGLWNGTNDNVPNVRRTIGDQKETQCWTFEFVYLVRNILNKFRVSNANVGPRLIKVGENVCLDVRHTSLVQWVGDAIVLCSVDGKTLERSFEWT